MGLCVTRFIVAVSLAVLPAALAAQTCLGGASFAHRRAQVGTDVSSGTRARAVSAGLSLGSQVGPFASIGYGRAHDDGLDDDAIVFGGMVGIGLRLRANPTTAFCPTFSAGALNGALLPTGEPVSSQSFGIGGSIGTILSSTPHLEFIPFLGFATVTQTATIHNFSGITAAQTERHSETSLGMGVVFGKVLTIRPSAVFAKAGGRTGRTLGLRVSYSFGAVHRAAVVTGAGSGATVWLDPGAKMYYCQGSRMYGGTVHGDFTTEREALASGARPENGKQC